MSPKWFILIFSIFAVCALICNVMEGQSLGPSEQTVFQGVFEISLTTIFRPSWWSSIAQMMTWDYAIFKVPGTDTPNAWAFLKYVLFYPLSGATAVSFFLAIKSGGIF